MKEVKLNLHSRTIEMILPVFFGGLSSLLLCAFVETRSRGPADPVPAALVEIKEVTDLTLETAFWEQAEGEEEALEKEVFALAVGKPEKRRDIIQETYRNGIREWVIAFFEEICHSRELAEAILVNVDANDISPALAFALSWEESRFNPRAVNTTNRNESIDRGLFQLNNRSFPRLEDKSFFDPQINSQYAMQHLRHCLDIGGSEIAALAMYNAGSEKVRNAGTPKRTLDYINRILENRRTIESRFELMLEREEARELARKEAEAALLAEAEEEPPRSRVWFALLGKL